MDKLNNVLGTGFKKENLVESGHENRATDVDFGEVFAGESSKNESLRKDNRQGVSSKKGKELPEKRESATSGNNDAEKKVKLADKIVESDSEEIEKTNKDDLESVESTNNLETVPVGASINIITNTGTVDDDSLFAYAEQEGIDGVLMKKLLGLKNSPDSTKNILVHDINGQVSVADIGELKSNEKMKVSGTVENKKAFSVLPIATDSASGKLVKQEASSGKADTIGKVLASLPEMAQQMPLVVSMKIRPNDRATLVRLKDGEASGKIIAIEPINFESNEQLSKLLQKAQASIKPELGGNIVSPDPTNISDDQGLGPSLNSGGKSDFQSLQLGELVKTEDTFRKIEQFQLISQKMSEALGQRLTAQISKGIWQVQIALRPEQLGRIDIQLGVNGGELEAVFKAGNILTRELIVDGLPRLRDILEESGMEVANLFLDDQNGRANDGKSSDSENSANENESGVNSGQLSDNKGVQSSTVSDDNVDILV